MYVAALAGNRLVYWHQELVRSRQLLCVDFGVGFARVARSCRHGLHRPQNTIAVPTCRSGPCPRFPPGRDFLISFCGYQTAKAHDEIARMARSYGRLRQAGSNTRRSAPQRASYSCGRQTAKAAGKSRLGRRSYGWYETNLTAITRQETPSAESAIVRSPVSPLRRSSTTQ
jgi:hypothetical protein